jgi:hypothetical protein
MYVVLLGILGVFCGYGQIVSAKDVGQQPMYRLYHKGNYEHFYTASKHEAQTLVNSGWQSEGVGFYAPKKSNTPVYRLYNPQLKDHHYTTSKNEKDVLVAKHGWRYEGIGWYSSDAKKIPVHRLFQPALTSGSHHYTTSSNERDTLAAQHKWVKEGVAWYALKLGEPLLCILPDNWTVEEKGTDMQYVAYQILDYYDIDSSGGWGATENIESKPIFIVRFTRDKTNPTVVSNEEVIAGPPAKSSQEISSLLRQLGTKRISQLYKMGYPKERRLEVVVGSKGTRLGSNLNQQAILKQAQEIGFYMGLDRNVIKSIDKSGNLTYYSGDTYNVWK